jgi:hypothetical protein
MHILQIQKNICDLFYDVAGMKTNQDYTAPTAEFDCTIDPRYNGQNMA